MLGTLVEIVTACANVSALVPTDAFAGPELLDDTSIAIIESAIEQPAGGVSVSV